MKQHHPSPAAEALCRAQQQLIDEIYAHARRLGLSNDNLWPIPDGIYVPEPKAGTEAADLSTLEAYLSGTRVMWVLKEPYDETEGDSPSGGGWNMFEAFDNGNAWANRTWQSIIYAMHGLFAGKHWQEMDWIRDDKQMAQVLKRIAYINISKMPALTQTDDGQLQELYERWRPILLRQIEVYDPQVIVFGNTFRYFKNDLAPGAAQPDQVYGGHAFHTYVRGGRLLIDAYHPNQRVLPRGEYVDSLIDIIRSYEAENLHP